MTVLDAIRGDARLQRVQLDARTARHFRRARRQVLRALQDHVRELAARNDHVDQSPLHGALPLDSLRQRRESVRQIPAHLALVDDARQAARAGEHPEERYLGQRHGRRTVVDQDNLVARERQLVTAARRRAVARREEADATLGAGLLDVEPRLVGVLAEVDLERVGCRREHVDVRARAENAVMPGRDHRRLYLGMREPQALHGIGELDVDGQVVGVALQLDLAVLTAERLHLHRQASDVAVDGERPVPISAGVRLERRQARRGGRGRVHACGKLTHRLDLRKQYSA